MSKSFGNVVDPIEMLVTYNPEIIKSYMLIFGPCLKDANFDEHEMITFHNTFVNTIGIPPYSFLMCLVNCYSRMTGKAMSKNIEKNLSFEEVNGRHSKFFLELENELAFLERSFE